MVGVKPSLQVHGKDLAGGQVIANNCVSNVPQDSLLPSVVPKQAPAKLYKANSLLQVDLRAGMSGKRKKVVCNQVFVVESVT